MRILLTGRDGQVGSELARRLSPFGEVRAYGHRDLDLADLDRLRAVVRDVQPQWIVNAAAYTQVDRAEDEPELARKINADAVGVLGEEARRIGALVVHYSTDYVFNGEKQGAYREEDEAGPLNQYGATKLAGERALADSGCSHYVFRTSWVYAARGTNFLRKILQLARERDELTVVDDQHGAPTAASHIAEATASVLKDAHTGAADRYGIYHMTAGGETTWHGFAEAIVAEWGRVTGGSELQARRIVPIASATLRQRARRPANSVLSNEKLRRVFGVALPAWRDQLRGVIEELRQSKVGGLARAGNSD